jgi:putative phage-type endonuclease
MVTTRRTLATREEWLGARRLGGSDVAAILGLSSYRGPWSVYARLVEGVRDDADGPDAARGRLLEPVVLRKYAEATGATLERLPPHTLFERDEWATASVDAIALAPRRIVEVKTDRNRDRWGEPCTIERWTPEAGQVVRRDYWLQVAHYMHVLDVDRADLAVLVPGDDPFIPELRIFHLLRDREVEEALVEHLRAWWTRHIVGREPPELDGSDAAGAHLGQIRRAGARSATLGEVTLSAAYATARRNAADWEAHRKTLGQLLVASAGDAARLDLPRGHVSIVRNPGKPTLDERALLADHPDLAPVLAEYRRTSNAYAYPAIAGLETP